jgi:hypothetical protein
MAVTQQGCKLQQLKSKVAGGSTVARGGLAVRPSEICLFGQGMLAMITKFNASTLSKAPPDTGLTKLKENIR